MSGVVVDPISVSSTRRALLADVCRGRPRRPLSLLRPRFLRRGVVVAVPSARDAPPPPPPPPPPLEPAVLFDEVAFDVACEDGCTPQHLRTVPMWVARPAEVAAAAATIEGARPSPPMPPLPPPPPRLLPAVLWIHGKTESRDTYLSVAESLARQQGCIAAVPDMPHHGGRRRRRRADGGADEFEAAVAAAVRTGEAGPLVLDWAWDALCALDALEALYGAAAEGKEEEQGEEGEDRGSKAAEGDGGGLNDGGGGGGGDEHSRPLTPREVAAYRRRANADGADWSVPSDVALDPGRVALAGVSMGGSAALFASVVADAPAPAPASSSSGGRPRPRKRVAACAPFIALQYWRWGLEHGDAWLGRAESLTPAFWAAIEAAAGAGAGAGGASETGEPGAGLPARRDAWQRAVARLLPGMLAHYDAPRLLAALRAAGVPLLACNSASDVRCPIDGVREAWREAEGERGAKGEGAEGAAAAAAEGGRAAGHELFVDPSARGHVLTPAMTERFEAWLSSVLESR